MPVPEPRPDRLPLDTPGRAAILEAHRLACVEGRAGYVDPQQGLFVFTALHHLGRGSCCDSGCRHCPYPDAPPRC